MPATPNLIGKQFEKLTVENRLPETNERGHVIWKCKCACGNVCYVTTGSLNSKNTRSCGCLSKIGAVKHGLRNSSEYRIWIQLKSRCYNENHEFYKDYGARGITVCDEWTNDFMAFYNDMGPRPSAHHSIDRRDNDKGYSKENCRWATAEEQQNNTRKNVLYKYKGIFKTLPAWCRELNLNFNKMRKRLELGWSIEEAFEGKSS